MRVAATIKSLAAWTLTAIDPYTALLWRRGGEQSLPLLIAIPILIINIAVIGLVIVAVLVWLVSKIV